MKMLAPGRSPYAHKARVMVAEKGIACEIVETGPGASEVAAANPLAKVPTLIRDDGRPLYDSSVIVEYLDGLADTPNLIPEAFEARIEVRRWEALGNGIMDATVTISHENRLPIDQRKGPDFYEKHQKKIAAGLATMEKDLGTREFCYGDSFTLADISCGCALVYLDKAMPDMDWRKICPGLARHAERLAQRPSFSNG